MFEYLNYDITHTILDFLESKSLRIISTLNKFFKTKFKQLIYYRHALEKKQLYSLDYFIKDEFIIAQKLYKLVISIDYSPQVTNLDFIQKRFENFVSF